MSMPQSLPGMSTWLAFLALIGVSSSAVAQDLEPRRWTQLPVGTSFVAAGYSYSTGDLAFDPVLLIEDADVELHTALLSFTHYFAISDRTARIDVVLPAQSGEWDGVVDGAPRTVNRDGLADPVVRLSTNLFGPRALTGVEFMDYRRDNPVQTSVGAALELRLPLGEYQEDKLINLGNNRFALGTQLGVLHTRGEWSYELTGTMYVFTDNDEFFNGNTLEQDPLFTAQAHVVKTFGPDYWLSVGSAYTWAGESSINGESKDDEKSALTYGSAFGFRLGETQSLRFTYIRNDTLTEVGADSNSFVVGWSMRF